MVWWRRIHTCCLCHRPWYVQLGISFMTISTLWWSPWETASFVSLRPSEVCKAKVYGMLKVKVKQKLPFFFWGQSFKIVLWDLPTQEQNKQWKMVIGLIRWRLKHKLVVCTVSRCTTWLHVSWKLKVLFPYGVSEFCLPHKKFSFKLNVKMYLSWAVRGTCVRRAFNLSQQQSR